jgi:hypothetical protein
LVVAVPYNACGDTKCNDVSAYTVFALFHVKREVVEQEKLKGLVSDFCIDHPGVQDHRGFSRIKTPQLRTEPGNRQIAP